MTAGGNAVQVAGPAVLASGSEEMAAFDALPAELRAALREAPEGWSAVNILARWRRAAAQHGEARATLAGLRVLREAAATVPPGRPDQVGG
jgi:hypothetical protein